MAAHRWRPRSLVSSTLVAVVIATALLPFHALGAAPAEAPPAEAPPAAASASQAPGSPGACRSRKIDVLDYSWFHVWNAARAFTRSEAGVVGVGYSTSTLRRLERQYTRAQAACPPERLRIMTRFMKVARTVLPQAMDQVALERLLAALDRWELRQTGSVVGLTAVERLHKCQQVLTRVQAWTTVSYAPRSYGRAAWVDLYVDNATHRDLWVDLSGTLVAVDPVREEGRYSERRGGWVLGWGGSSADMMIAGAEQVTSKPIAPAGAYPTRLRAEGSIVDIQHDLWVGRLGCAPPVPLVT